MESERNSSGTKRRRSDPGIDRHFHNSSHRKNVFSIGRFRKNPKGVKDCSSTIDNMTPFFSTMEKRLLRYLVVTSSNRVEKCACLCLSNSRIEDLDLQKITKVWNKSVELNRRRFGCIRKKTLNQIRDEVRVILAAQQFSFHHLNSKHGDSLMKKILKEIETLLETNTMLPSMGDQFVEMDNLMEHEQNTKICSADDDIGDEEDERSVEHKSEERIGNCTSQVMMKDASTQTTLEDWEPSDSSLYHLVEDEMLDQFRIDSKIQWKTKVFPTWLSQNLNMTAASCLRLKKRFQNRKQRVVDVGQNKPFVPTVLLGASHPLQEPMERSHQLQEPVGALEYCQEIAISQNQIQDRVEIIHHGHDSPDAHEHARLKFESSHGSFIRPRDFPEGFIISTIDLQEVNTRENFTEDECYLYKSIWTNPVERSKTRSGKQRQIKWKAFHNRWIRNAKLAISHATIDNMRVPQFYNRSQTQLKDHRREQKFD